MSYHSELHYQMANTSPCEVWGGFSETEDGFEPLSDDELDRMADEALAAWNQALDERAFDVAEDARREVLAAQRLTEYRVEDEPF